MSPSLCAQDLRARWRPTKDLAAARATAAQADALILKLADDAGVRAANGHLVRGGAVDPSPVQVALAGLPGVRVTALSQLDPLRLRALRARAERASGEEMADLTQLFRVTWSQAADLDAVLAALLALPAVENVYGEPRYRVASTSGGGGTPTPDLDLATYINDVELPHAHAQGYFGEGVTIADVEVSWNLPITARNWSRDGHEDLAGVTFETIDDPADWVDPTEGITPIAYGLRNEPHGTAVVGVLLADDNGTGLTGMVPNAELKVISDTIQAPGSPFIAPLNRLMDAVVLATEALEPGDLMLIERQGAGPNLIPPGIQAGSAVGFVPVEYTDAIFYCVRQATAMGIHVVQPSGNGSQNLDATAPIVGGHATYPGAFDLNERDSRSVIVSGVHKDGTFPTTIFPAGVGQIVNVGSRIDAYAEATLVRALGEHRYLVPLGAIACGAQAFPALWYCESINRAYTAAFQGTSASSAIVAGAMTVLEQAHEELYGEPLRPEELRGVIRHGGARMSSLTSGSTAIGREPRLERQLDLIEMGPHPAWVMDPTDYEQCDSTQQWRNFGERLGVLEDLNGDGLPEYYVAYDYTQPDGTSRQGYRFYSGRSGDLLDTILHSIPFGGTDDGTYAPAGDVDGNGVADLVFFNGGSQVQVVELDLAAGTGSTIATVTAGNGFSGGIGDVNGDGFDDFAAGGEVHLGPSGTLLLIGGVSVDGVRGGVGDLDGDGRAELYDIDGRMRSVHGAPGAETLVEFNPNIALPLPGAGMLAIGDVDLDAVPDLLTRDANGQNAQGHPVGLVWIHSGKTGALIAKIEGPHFGSKFGGSAAAPGDVNGDGFPDFAVGLPDPIGLGQVYVYSGLNLSQGPVLLAQYAAERGVQQDLFSSTISAGDLNGDGLGDLLIGAPAAETTAIADCADGRAYVFHSLRAQQSLVASPSFFEAFDADGDLYGGSAPHDRSFLTLDLGPAFANAPYAILGGASGSLPGLFLEGVFIPLVYDNTTTFLLSLGASTPPGSAFNVAGFSGTLDASGRAEAEFGPVLASVLCPTVGLEFTLVGLGWNPVTFQLSVASDPARVRITNEEGTCP
ncbi:MAG: S8 family serine peptidase [Planctomycetota bacterium]